MKYTLAIVALLGLTAGIQKSGDDKKGTSAAPIPFAPVGGMAKPSKAGKEFKAPKNNDAEPALSTTMDPYDYESGSGKTYHNKSKKVAKDEGPKKPEPIAGLEESTETAGTTTLWKINAGDSPDPKKIKDSDSEKEDKEEKKEKKSEKKDDDKSSDSESFAQKFRLNPSAPVSNNFIQTEMELEAGCEPAIDVSQKQLDIELDYFSRNFDRKHYKKAMQVYKELKKQGLNPKTSIHTWELYDGAFSFPRVRRYDLVQKHMDLLQHFQDNLNENFTNQLAVDNFVRVANNARESLNAKYHNGEFSDPADFDPQADHPTTWANANI